MDNISIVIPIIRTEAAERCMCAIKKNASGYKGKYEIVTQRDPGGVGCPGMVKKIVKKTKYDLVMFLGDDTEPGKDFLKNAMSEMEKLPDGWGVVGLNTQDINKPEGNPLAHWMAHKKILKHIPGGDFFSTEYIHCFCDNELRDVASELGRWGYARESKIIHNHPINKTAKYDEGYKKAYGDGNWGSDHKTYCERKRKRMAKKYGVKLAIAVPLTDQQVYTQFFFSYIKVITEYMSSLASAGMQINIDILMPDFPCQVDVARNNLVAQAQNLGCTHILMMDTDQVYCADNMVSRLLAHKKPVVGAMVHRRYPPFDPILLRGEVGGLHCVPDNEVIDSDGRYNSELSVEYTGAGCTMYDMSIFNNMMPDIFFEFTVGEKGQPIGEDIGFCEKLKKKKIPIIVDCTIDIKHLTTMAVDWNTYKLFKEMLKRK